MGHFRVGQVTVVWSTSMASFARQASHLPVFMYSDFELMVLQGWLSGFGIIYHLLTVVMDLVLRVSLCRGPQPCPIGHTVLTWVLSIS